MQSAFPPSAQKPFKSTDFFYIFSLFLVASVTLKGIVTETLFVLATDEIITNSIHCNHVLFENYPFVIKVRCMLARTRKYCFWWCSSNYFYSEKYLSSQAGLKPTTFWHALYKTFTLFTLVLSSENVLHRNTTYVHPSEFSESYKKSIAKVSRATKKGEWKSAFNPNLIWLRSFMT